MKRILLLTVFALLLIAPSPVTKVGSRPTGDFTDMPNPASVYCLSHPGYKLEIREDEDGAQYGVCKHGYKECDEWDFFNGICSLDLGKNYREVK